jgi:hypothetical protein
MKLLHRALRKLVVASAVLTLILTPGTATKPVPRRTAKAAEPVFGTFIHVDAAALHDATLRRGVARRYGTVVIHGPTDSATIRTLHDLNPALKILTYEEAAALNEAETSMLLANHPQWLARDAHGKLIHPRAIPDKTLGDLTNPRFRAWRSRQVVREVSLGADGSYYDTLASFWPATFYTGRPHIDGAPVTDAAWRDANVALVNRTRGLTQKPLIANGFGISGGITYHEHQDDSDRLIAAADGVQLENWTRASRTQVDVFKDEVGWQQDLSYLRSLAHRDKIALAYTKVGVPATREQLRNLRDYALGSFLLGIAPGRASFSFDDQDLETLPSLRSDPPWSVELGPPTSGMTDADVRVRGFTGGRLSVNPTSDAQTFDGISMPAHTMLVESASGRRRVSADSSSQPCRARLLR